MNDRLENLRIAFPAEVTGAFLAARVTLGPGTQYKDVMLGFLLILVVINLWIYWRFLQTRSPNYLVYVTIGFLLWAAMIDRDRLIDLFFGFYEPFVPLALILYSLIAAYVPLPRTQGGGQ